MTSQASPQEPSFYSDPFNIIPPCNSPRQCQQVASQPSKLQQETAMSLPCPYPVSIRTYNRKDYNYIASFPGATHAGMKPNQSKSELSQCPEIHYKCTDDAAKSSNMHPPQRSHRSLPEFGANVEAASPSSTDRYADVYDCIREQKRGGSSPAPSLPQHLRTPVRGLAKELAVAKIPSRAIPHHRKWLSSSWSRCFVAPLTTE